MDKQSEKTDEIVDSVPRKRSRYEDTENKDVEDDFSMEDKIDEEMIPMGVGDMKVLQDQNSSIFSTTKKRPPETTLTENRLDKKRLRISEVSTENKKEELSIANDVSIPIVNNAINGNKGVDEAQQLSSKIESGLHLNTSLKPDASQLKAECISNLMEKLPPSEKLIWQPQIVNETAPPTKKIEHDSKTNYIHPLSKPKISLFDIRHESTTIETEESHIAQPSKKKHGFDNVDDIKKPSTSVSLEKETNQKPHLSKNCDEYEEDDFVDKKIYLPANVAQIILFVFLMVEFIILFYSFDLFKTHITSSIPIPQNKVNSPLLVPPSNTAAEIANITLREYLTHPDGFHLGMAPAFFGFYAYFGALIIFDEELQLLPNSPKSNNLLKSVAGASAGAMSASLIGIGLSPRHAAEYVSSFNLASFADPPGLLGLLRGEKFEEILRDYMKEKHGIHSRKYDESSSIKVEESLIPLSVTGFDLLTWKGMVIRKGDLAQATRASATFPGLFQPVFVWEENSSQIFPSAILIDGGIHDQYGVKGLLSSGVEKNPDLTPKRIVNLSVGSLTLNPKNPPPGPLDFEIESDENVDSVLSITLMNTPNCGPLKMENGPLAVEAARKAIEAVLDVPMYKGKDPGHYEVHIDTSFL